MKKQITPRKRQGLLALASAAAVVAAACALALPTAALAETSIAHSIGPAGEEIYYSTIGAAKTAGYAGATIIMDADWDLGEDKLEIADSKSLSIDMNGHRITSSNTDATIYVNEHASFSLTSSAKATEFSFKGYGRTGRSGDFTVSSGGLISNTDDGQAGLGQTIHVESYAHFELENVAVVGGGECGLYINSDCSVELSRATVCHNGRAENNLERQGGGIYLDGDSTLTLTESHVDDNYSNCFGGGIYVGIRASVLMEEGSTVSRNWALSAGGGIYVTADGYLIKSADGTGTISENGTYDHGATIYKDKRSGGGIYVSDISGRDLKGTIEGLIIKDNYSAYDGGGLELDQRNTTVRDCVITGNYAARDGGGVCVYDKGITFEGCTITENYCDAGGGAHEGGGIFVSYHYDLNVKGKNIIKGNTRGKGTGNADDVFLSTLSGGGGKAYIKGTLEQGSSVGVRTGIEGDRRIAEEFKPESKDCLFMDLSGYYVSYGTDEGGDAWQRHTTKEFTATVDGGSAAKYRQGSKATLVAPATTGDLVFWHWDLDKTTGLYPIGDYITNEAAFSNTLTFKMPQNDVDAVPVYVTRAKKVAIALEAPAAGQALPASAELYRLDGAGLRGPFGAAVSWYEVAEDGSRTRATGAAKAGTAYAAEVTVKGDSYYGLYFNSSVAAADVTLKAGSGDGPAVESASVDSGTGALTVKTAAFAKTAGEAADVKTGQVTVNVEKRALLDGASGAAALSDEADDKYVVTYTYTDESDEVTITAPAVEGHNFACWEDTGSGHVEDAAALGIKVSALLSIDSLTAVYTPVATRVEVDMAAPATGEELADTAADVRVSCWDGQEGSFADALEADGFKVTWAPEPDDGVAAPGTTYTALIEICDVDGVTDAERAMATDAVVTCGGVKATAAGFVVVDGKFCLAIALPPTADEETEPTEPDDPGKTDEDEKPDDSGKEEDANANKGQVNDQPATTVTTTVTTSKAAKKGTPSTGDVTFAAAGALLVVSAICLAAAGVSRRDQH